MPASEAENADNSQPGQGLPTYAVKGSGAAMTADEFNFMEAVGGVRGIADQLLPPAVFLLTFIIWQDLTIALVSSLGTVAILLVTRLLLKQKLTGTLGGTFGVLIGVIWAWQSANASDYFLPGLIINVTYGLAFLISILVRWPLIGVILALALGKKSTWRSDPSIVRRVNLVSWFWVGLFTLRSIVQIPLYLLDNVVALGLARLLMGLPLMGLVIWVSWILLRPVVPRLKEMS